MSSGVLPLVLVIIGGLAALGCLILAFRMFWRKRLVDDLPTSKAQGVFIGLVELNGTAESEKTLTSYLAGARCVYYSWHVEEHWSRTVTETYTDDKGQVRTRTRVESGWNRVAGGVESVPFYLKDDSGVIRIVPKGAQIHDVKVFSETCSPGNPLYYGKGPATDIADSTHRRRFVETALPLHTMLYVMGQAREREDIVAPEIAHDKSSSMFLISTKTEKQLSSRYGRWLWFWVILGLAFAVGLAGTGSQLRSAVGLSWQPYMISASCFFIALLLGWIWMIYNSLVNLHHRMEQGWSQVDVQMKRRHDLIPNLENIVKGYRVHESEVQQLLTELRAQSEATPPGAAGPDFKGVLPTLRGIVERYPELKAGEQFLKLQHELAETEERIALARGYFNDIATFYNTRLGIIPDRFIGAMAGLRPAALMSASGFERAPIDVKLAD